MELFSHLCGLYCYTDSGLEPVATQQRGSREESSRDLVREDRTRSNGSRSVYIGSGSGAETDALHSCLFEDRLLPGCASRAFQHGHDSGLFGVFSACLRVLRGVGFRAACRREALPVR